MGDCIRVLMVDDEAQFRITTSKILERRGFETILAASGKEALEKLDQNPDVVILDVKMEEMDGNQTLVEIKKQFPDLPIIMITGHGDLVNARKALTQGAFDYLNKPCDIEILASRIRDAYRAGHHMPLVEKNASDLMIPFSEYQSISLDATIAEAITTLRENAENVVTTDTVRDEGRRSLLVFDKENNFVGLLTPLALLNALRPAYLSATLPSTTPHMYSMGYSALFWRGLFTRRVKDMLEVKVEDVMHEAPPSVDVDANLMEVIQLMHSTDRRRLTVTKDKKAIGLIREQELFYELTKTMQVLTSQSSIRK